MEDDYVMRELAIVSVMLGLSARGYHVLGEVDMKNKTGAKLEQNWSKLS